MERTLWGVPDEFELALYLTILLLCIKVILIAFLSSRIFVEKRNVEKTPLPVLYSGVVIFITLFISRLFYLTFDFFQTQFNPLTYTLYPNIYIWKTGTFISAAGVIYGVWVIERKILLNKTRAIVTITMILLVVIQFFYPVREGVASDFQLVSNFGLAAAFGVFILPIVIFWLGRVSPGLQKYAGTFFIGTFVYAAGGAVVSGGLMDFAFAIVGVDLAFTLSICLKITGLFLLAYSFSNIRKINKGLIDYYHSKRICIVHRGHIQGKAFMCSTCNVMYCEACKKAIVEIENKCWNCKAPIAMGIELAKDLAAKMGLGTSTSGLTEVQELGEKQSADDVGASIEVPGIKGEGREPRAKVDSSRDFEGKKK
nr:hypothetical protein [Candidatus Sigynarchaeota archaeon]